MKQGNHKQQSNQQVRLCIYAKAAESSDEATDFVHKFHNIILQIFTMEDFLLSNSSPTQQDTQRHIVSLSSNIFPCQTVERLCRTKSSKRTVDEQSSTSKDTTINELLIIYKKDLSFGE